MSQPNQGSNNQGIAAVDLFCGAGGLAFGLRSAGIEVVAGVDLDPHCRHPFEANCDAKFVCKDVTTVTAAELGAWYGPAKFRLLAGCAPCQPFSTYSQNRKNPDERWRLLREFRRLALAVKPEIVTMENVRGLANRPVWGEFVASLTGAGYHVAWDEVGCDDFGVPQVRRRLVLVASLLGPIKMPEPPMDLEAPTVRNAIGHLPPLVAGGSDPNDPLHASSRLSERNVERIQASRAGGSWRDWPEHLRAECHVRKTGETYPSVYGRMEWGRPAPTLTTQFYGFGNGRYGHPEQDRAVSLREAAILQSFPETYSFVAKNSKITFRNVGIMIGNAVPPKLGEAIGRAIQRHVDQATRS